MLTFNGVMEKLLAYYRDRDFHALTEARDMLDAELVSPQLQDAVIHMPYTDETLTAMGSLSGGLKLRRDEIECTTPTVNSDELIRAYSVDNPEEPMIYHVLHVDEVSIVLVPIQLGGS